VGGAAVPVAMGGASLLGSLLGGGQGQFSTGAPGNLAGAQNSQLNLLNSLLPQNQGQGNALSSIQNYFGNLGVPQTDLQRQSAGGISQFLQAGSPAMQAQNEGFKSLEAIMNPATSLQFQQGLSLANQPGQRFSSGNEILRAQALTNQQGLAMQAAQAAGMLGNAQLGQFGQGFGVGTQQAQQGDVNLQRLLSLFGGLFGARQQMVGGLPITQQPPLGQQLGQFGGGLMSLLPFLSGGGGGGGGLPAETILNSV
jgi:hypothetical protein